MKKSIHQLFEEFIYEAQFAKRVRAETIQGYKNTFQLFKKLTPDLTLDSINTHSVVRFFKLLQERKRIVGKGQIRCGVKKSTIATYWCKLNVYFEWLTSNGYIKENPFKEMKYPAPSYEDKKYLRKEDVEKILSSIHLTQTENILLFKRNLVLFSLLLFCGLRREEVMLLQIRDINLIQKQLTIRSESSKSGKTRLIPLHSSTLMHLKDYLNERKKYTTPYLIVSNRRDDKLTHNGLKHLVDKVQRNSGVKFHLHQFRHTFAVNFLKTTNNIFKLKLILGHQDIRVTMAYLRCLPTSELRGDLEAMSIDSFI